MPNRPYAAFGFGVYVCAVRAFRTVPGSPRILRIAYRPNQSKPEWVFGPGGRNLVAVDTTATFVVSVLFQVVFFVLGAALLAGGIAALRERLPGNSWFGVRTPETRESPEAWTISNKAAAPGFLAAGGALILAGLGLLLVDGVVAVAIAVLGVLVALGMASFAGLAGSKAAAIWLENARRTGTLPESMDPNAMSSSCCSAGGGAGAAGDETSSVGASAGASSASGSGSPASDCGVTGGCGSCSLKGMCAPEGSHQH